MQVYEILQVEATPVLAMEYVEGRDLAEVVTIGRPSEREIGRILIAACEGISHAHAHGVLHRDIKPRNILLSKEGVPKVTDFGLALKRGPDHQAGDGRREEPESIAGSPAYMAPEQTEGRPSLVSTRTDVYALSATLYFGLTGRLPVTGSTVTQVLERAAQGRIIPPRAINPAISRDLEAICLKAMSRDQEMRYTRARQMGSDPRRALAGLPVRARRYSPWEAHGRAIRTRREAFVLGVVLVTLMAAGLTGAVSMLYGTAHDAIVTELRSKVRDLANTAVMMVDAGLVEATRAPARTVGEEARQLAATLEPIRQRSPDVAYVWIMRPSGRGGTCQRL